MILHAEWRFNAFSRYKSTRVHRKVVINTRLTYEWYIKEFQVGLFFFQCKSSLALVIPSFLKPRNSTRLNGLIDGMEILCSCDEIKKRVKRVNFPLHSQFNATNSSQNAYKTFSIQSSHDCINVCA